MDCLDLSNAFKAYVYAYKVRLNRSSLLRSNMTRQLHSIHYPHLLSRTSSSSTKDFCHPETIVTRTVRSFECHASCVQYSTLRLPRGYFVQTDGLTDSHGTFLTCRPFFNLVCRVPVPGTGMILYLYRAQKAQQHDDERRKSDADSTMDAPHTRD